MESILLTTDFHQFLSLLLLTVEKWKSMANENGASDFG